MRYTKAGWWVPTRVEQGMPMLCVPRDAPSPVCAVLGVFIGTQNGTVVPVPLILQTRT
jgi:hypothetical protein